MCDNAAKTIGSNHLKHIALPFNGTKKTCESELARSHRFRMYS
jgi:hypothetical protein